MFGIEVLKRHRMLMVPFISEVYGGGREIRDFLFDQIEIRNDP